MEELYNFLKESRENILSKWNRVLPSNELLYDRWDKAKLLGFGDGSSVYDSCVIIGNVTAGKNVWVGPFTMLDGSGGLIIGDNCDISTGVQIYSHDTVMRVLSGGEKDIEYKQTNIEENCHIGAGCIILKGVTIGHHSVIGAGSIVTKSFPPYSIIIGVPGKKVGNVEVGKDINFIYD